MRVRMAVLITNRLSCVPTCQVCGPAWPFLPLAPKPVQEESFFLLDTSTTLWKEPDHENVTEEPGGRKGDEVRNKIVSILPGLTQSWAGSMPNFQTMVSVVVLAARARPRLRSRRARVEVCILGLPGGDCSELEDTVLI